jgi:hypothetical protein
MRNDLAGVLAMPKLYGSESKGGSRYEFTSC